VESEPPTSNAELARRALEDVCARGDLEAAKELYAADFVDHVNGRTFHGQAGIRQSVTVYAKLFENLRMHVDEQAADGERVASRWTLSGTRSGRRVNLSGMTISRLSDGKIVEDRTVSDTVGLLRQLGVRRSLGVAFDWYRGAK
jgi:ketosteroid isomerase-like protein